MRGQAKIQEMVSGRGSADRRGWLSRFRRDEEGSATIEAVLWIPMFMFLTVLIADTSFIFFGRAQAMRLI